MNRLFTIMLIGLSAQFLVCCQNQSKPESEEQKAQAPRVHEEYMQPVRPGIEDSLAYWNTYSMQFMYAPAFAFESVRDVRAYRYEVVSEANQQSYTFEADNPREALSPVWAQLPVGFARLTVTALDSTGKEAGFASTRRFYRSAPYTGGYHTHGADFKAIALKGLKYINKQDYIQAWLGDSLPDMSKNRYFFPSLIIGTGVVDGHVVLARHAETPGQKEQYTAIARRAADYLLSVSKPAGEKYAYFPPTYNMDDAWTARAFPRQLMMLGPAKVGYNYLNLYDLTGEQKYLDAATDIADTYVKTQEAGGTWPFVVHWDTGEKLTENKVNPIYMIWLFDRLEKEHGQAQYAPAKAKALDWILANPAHTYNWEGQFEDVLPTPPHKNLTKIQLCETALYLLAHHDENQDYLPLAIEMIRFAEDQFVVWERPMPLPLDGIYHVGHATGRWITPCALEQYFWYLPIDGSASYLINCWISAYEATGNERWLNKARDMALPAALVQNDEGKLPTYWIEPDVVDDWINSTVFFANSLIRLSEIEK